MNDEQKKQEYSGVRDQEIRTALALSPQVLEVVLACSCANRQHAQAKWNAWLPARQRRHDRADS
jgi:hypothetical protein